MFKTGFEFWSLDIKICLALGRELGQNGIYKLGFKV